MDDDKIVQDVNKSVKTFHQSIDQNLKRGTFENVVILDLHEKKEQDQRTSGFWISSEGMDYSPRLRRNPWEKWSIKVNVHFAENEQETKQFRVLAEKQLRACLFYISSINITELNHVPFLINEKSIHYHKISVPSANYTESWTSLLKKMISESAIPSILK